MMKMGSDDGRRVSVPDCNIAEIKAASYHLGSRSVMNLDLFLLLSGLGITLAKYFTDDPLFPYALRLKESDASSRYCIAALVS